MKIGGGIRILRLFLYFLSQNLTKFLKNCIFSQRELGGTPLDAALMDCLFFSLYEFAGFFLPQDIALGKIELWKEGWSGKSGEKRHCACAWQKKLYWFKQPAMYTEVNFLAIGTWKTGKLETDKVKLNNHTLYCHSYSFQ